MAMNKIDFAEACKKIIKYANQGLKINPIVLIYYTLGDAPKEI